MLNRKLTLVLLTTLTSTLPAVADTKLSEDAKFSYAIGVKLSEQVQNTQDISNMPEFIAGFRDKQTGTQSRLSAEQLSYAQGNLYSDFISNQGLDIDKQLFLEAFEDAISDKPLKMTSKEVQEKIDSYMAALQEQQKEIKEKEMKEQAAKNKAEGDKYLSANKAKADVTTTTSGLQYKVITKAKKQAHPTADATVKVHYVGKFIDGQEFDSSVARKEPAQFMVQQVIPGWVEVLQLMSPGDKWEVSIPADLAYADFAPPSIGPNKTLIFEIELLEVL